MIGIFSQPYNRRRLLLFTGDIILVLLSLLSIQILEYFQNTINLTKIDQFIAVYAVLVVLIVTIFYIFELYDITKPKADAINLTSILSAFVIILIVYSCLAYFFVLLRFGKIKLIIFTCAAVILTWAWRTLFSTWITLKPQGLLLVGNDPIFTDIRRVIQEQYGQYYTIQGHWHRHSHNPTLPNLVSYLKDHQVEAIVYSVNSEVAKQLSNDMINIQFSGKKVIDAFTFYQQLTRKYPVYFLNDFWLLINAKKEIIFPTIAGNLKRAVDIIFAVLLLPLALPVMALSALAIKLDSPGPVLFIQERLGRNEVPFLLYKFRTMIHHAEALTGPVWSDAKDPRITRVGRVLRKLRLDELPQLFNVLKGDISVVGPRPIRKFFADKLAQEVPYYRLRFLAKPGLTGWAQVNHDYAGSTAGQAEKLQYDLYYLVHQSFWLDLFILFKTIKVMVWGKGI
jgi:exopolysaccharide biosynthesis polyprenyl glycosylphosphotransferase